MTSTERSRKYRAKLNDNSEKKEEFLAKERERDCERRKIRKFNKCKNKLFRIKDSEREKLRKRRQRANKRLSDDCLPKITTPVLTRSFNVVQAVKRKASRDIRDLRNKMRKLKNENRRLNRHLTIASTINANSCEEIVDSTSPNISIKDMLTPSTKHRVKVKLNELSQRTHGLNTTVRKLFKMNVSNVSPVTNKSSQLRQEVLKFANEDHISKICPDKKKVKKAKGNIEIQLRYRLDYLSILYEKFLLETSNECHYTTFTRYFPNHVIKPRLEDWGTCLCRKCLNPQMKIEKLQDMKILPRSLTAESYSQQPNFIQKIEEIDIPNENVIFLQWNMVTVEDKKKKSRKETMSLSRAEFKKTLTTEIQELQKHIERAVTQYRAVKRFKSLAQDDEGLMVLQADWSENAKLFQTRQEHSAYYDATQVSVHAMIAWYGKESQCIAQLSDCTNHKCAGIWASICPILEKYKHKGKTKFVIVTDSPTSQYRNKYIVAVVQTYALKYGLDITWLYLEAGHGKGPADGVGAAVKRAIDDSLAMAPEISVSNAFQTEQLIKNRLHNVKLQTFTSEDVDKVKSHLDHLPIDSLKVVDIMKVHEIKFGKERIKTKLLSCCSKECMDLNCNHNIYKELIWKPEAAKGGNTEADSSTYSDKNSMDGSQEAVPDLGLAIEESPYKVGDYIAVSFQDCWYPGVITSVDNMTFKVSCMEPTGTMFRWPSKKDIGSYVKREILMKVPPPLLVGSASRGHYQFPVAVTQALDEALSLQSN